MAHPRRRLPADADLLAAEVRRRDRDRWLAALYVPAARRRALMALWALDLELEQVARTATEPMLDEIKLAWWREALVRLDTAPPPPQPLLRELAEELLPLGVTGAALAGLEDRWLAWLAGDAAAAAGTAHLFDLAGRLLGEGRARRPLIGLDRLAARDAARAGAGKPQEPPGSLGRQLVLLRAVLFG